MDQTRDGPVALSPEEIQGRNTWLVWTAGDDRLWDVLGVTSVGAVDFLKVVSSHPSQKYSRACDPARLGDKSCQNRWEYFGLVNEPCFEKATGPDPGALEPVAGQAQARMRRRSIRERHEVSGRRVSARADAR